MNVPYCRELPSTASVTVEDAKPAVWHQNNKAEHDSNRAPRYRRMQSDFRKASDKQSEPIQRHATYSQQPEDTDDEAALQE